MNSPSRQALIQLLVVLFLGDVVLAGGGVTSAAIFHWQVINTVLGAALFGGWLVWRGVIRRARWPLTGLEWPLAGAALAGVLSLLASPDWRPGLARLGELAAFAALFYLAVDLLAAGFPRPVLSRALVVVSGIALFLSAAEIYLYYQPRWSDLFTQPLYRVVSLLGHPNLLAGLAALTLPLVLLEWRADNRLWARSGLLLWIACYVLVLPFTSSRGGLLALGVILTVLGGWGIARRGWTSASRLIEGPRGRGWIVGATIGAALTALAGLFIYQSLHPSHGGMSARLYIWNAAARVIAAHLWLGTGPGRFGVEAARVLSIPNQFWPLHAHSVFWQVFAEFGVNGLLALMGLIVGAARTLWRAARMAEGETRTQVIWLSAALAGYAAQNLVDDQTHVLATMVPLMLVLALAVTVGPVPAANLPRGRLPLAVLGLPFLLMGAMQAQWLWAYAAFDQARLAYAAGDSARALALTQEAARRDPSYAFYDVEAGLLAAQLAPDWIGGWPAAQAHFERAAAREENLAFVWANLGAARWRNGDRPGALAALQSAAQLAPLSATIQLTAGWMSEDAGQAEAAENYYRAALALRPDWASRPFWDVTPLRSAARDSAPPVLAVPDDPYPRARAALDADDPAEARKWLDIGLNHPSLTPTRRVEWQMVLGDILLAEGDEAGAMEQYTEALAAFANPSIEGTGYTFWKTYGVWLNARQPLPLDSVPGLMPLDVTPEMLTRFEQLAEWAYDHAECATARRVGRNLSAVDPDNAVARLALSRTCP
jgi:tetratricopeptide (TPR) repeat protein/O-antigen ligase